MKKLPLLSLATTFWVTTVCFAYAVNALAADAPRPLAPATALSLQEARVIIDGAVAFAREQKQRMTVVVLDEEGQLISADLHFTLNGSPKEKPSPRLSCAIGQKQQRISPRAAPTATSVSRVCIPVKFIW